MTDEAFQFTITIAGDNYALVVMDGRPAIRKLRNGVTYFPSVNADGTVSCSCLGYRHHQNCKHSKSIASLRALLSPPEPTPEPKPVQRKRDTADLTEM